jgi:hypothetical protein
LSPSQARPVMESEPLPIRSKADSAPGPEATPAVIDPNAVGSVAQWTAVLGVGETTLLREVRRGRLRASRRAGRYWITGEWLLAWIAGGETTRRHMPLAGGNGDRRQHGLTGDGRGRE